jgi:hypothetical protein
MAMPTRMAHAEPGPVESVHEDEAGERTMILLSLSPEMDRRLEELAGHYGRDKGEVINLAVGLLKFCRDAIEGGMRVGIASPEQDLDTEIKGL